MVVLSSCFFLKFLNRIDFCDSKATRFINQVCSIDHSTKKILEHSVKSIQSKKSDSISLDAHVAQLLFEAARVIEEYWKRELLYKFHLSLTRFTFL